MITLTIFSALSSYAMFELTFLYLSEKDKQTSRKDEYGAGAMSALIVLGLAWLVAIAIGQVLGG
jgi:uncharacterized protein (TIGR03382 family)